MKVRISNSAGQILFIGDLNKSFHLIESLLEINKYVKIEHDVPIVENHQNSSDLYEF